MKISVQPAFYRVPAPLKARLLKLDLFEGVAERIECFLQAHVRADHRLPAEIEIVVSINRDIAMGSTGADDREKKKGAMDKRTAIYGSVIDMNIDGWTAVDAAGNRSFAADEKMVADVEAHVSAAVATALLACGADPEAVDRFSKTFGASRSLAADQLPDGGGDSVGRELFLHDLSIVLDCTGDRVDRNVARRKMFQETATRALTGNKLGDFDGSAALVEQYEVSFLVRDPGLARAAIESALVNAGFRREEFWFEAAAGDS